MNSFLARRDGQSVLITNDSIIMFIIFKTYISIEMSIIITHRSINMLY